MIIFLEFIEQEVVGQKRDFRHLMVALGPQIQDRLSKEQYRDFVVYESNDIVRNLLEKTIRMDQTEDAKLSEQTLRGKQKKVSELCPTLFSPVESQIFLGISMLQTAGIESDPMRKDELVAKAMDHLMVDPTKFEMADVIPDLAKNRQF